VELSQAPVRARTVIKTIALFAQLGNVGDWVTTLVGASRPWWTEHPGLMRQAIATYGPVAAPTLVKAGAVALVAVMAWAAVWAARHGSVMWVGLATLIGLLGLYTWLAVLLNVAVLAGHR